LLLAVLSASAQTAPAPSASKAAPPISDHVKSDINRHRAMAQAHEAAARCLESGQGEEACMRALQASCKGLAIGKYCGMRHE
jgi:hypothetical protein